MLKAISIGQPWASAIVLGATDLDTRSFHTHWRGDVALHASLTATRTHLDNIGSMRVWREVLGIREGEEPELRSRLAFGAVLAIARLVECACSEEELAKYTRRVISERDRQLGDFSPGRFILHFAEVRPLKKPVVLPGKRGVWELYRDQEQAVRAQL